LAFSFEEILAASGRSHDASCSLMEAWVNAHPLDARAPRGLVWSAQLRLADGKKNLAQSIFLRVRREYPGTEWALHSIKGLADLDLSSRRYGDAIAKYDLLAKSDLPFFQYVGRMAAQQTRGERLRFSGMLSLVVGFLLLWTLRLVWFTAWRILWPPPVEVIYPLPILLLLLAASLGQPVDEARGIRMLALGGLLMLWLNGAYLRARRPAGGWRVVHAALGLGQAGALLYTSVVLSGLFEKFHDTLIMGAD
jgi:hypothetical protein